MKLDNKTYDVLKFTAQIVLIFRCAARDQHSAIQ